MSLTKLTVSLDYFRFAPTAGAYLTFTNPDHVATALRKTTNLSLFGHSLYVERTNIPQMHARTRGKQGRAEAAQRQLVIGTGSRGGITEVGRCVILSGLPGKVDASQVRSALLSGYRLAGGEGEVVPLPKCV